MTLVPTDGGAFTISAFLQQLPAIPWLTRLGQPSDQDRTVFRIYDWDVWPGPENPGSTIQAAYQMQWHGAIFGTTTYTEAVHDDLWQQIYAQVETITRPLVAYDDTEDAWYGPNAAVHGASWLTALVGSAIARHHPFLHTPYSPTHQWTLMNEWAWYRAGHWPCSYMWSWGYTELGAVERTGGPRRLIVF